MGPGRDTELAVCVNPAMPSEAYPVEKTSRVTLGCAAAVFVAFAVGSFFFVRLLTSACPPGCRPRRVVCRNRAEH